MTLHGWADDGVIVGLVLMLYGGVHVVAHAAIAVCLWFEDRRRR
jgi:hypothetical protein